MARHIENLVECPSYSTMQILTVNGSLHAHISKYAVMRFTKLSVFLCVSKKSVMHKTFKQTQFLRNHKSCLIYSDFSEH